MVVPVLSATLLTAACSSVRDSSPGGGGGGWVRSNLLTSQWEDTILTRHLSPLTSHRAPQTIKITAQTFLILEGLTLALGFTLLLFRERINLSKLPTVILLSS